MTKPEHGSTPTAVIERLREVSNSHDLDGIVACFSPNYRNVTPLHPARDFVGQEQVRRNWTQILAAIPDVETEIVSLHEDANTVWSEWQHRGTRHDGTTHLMRGVILFEVDDGVIASARFYLEPVDVSSDSVDLAVRRQVSPEAS